MVKAFIADPPSWYETDEQTDQPCSVSMPFRSSVHRPDDCPSEEDDNRVEFRPQCQWLNTGNTGIYPTGEGGGQMQRGDHQQSHHCRGGPTTKML